MYKFNTKLNPNFGLIATNPFATPFILFHNRERKQLAINDLSGTVHTILKIESLFSYQNKIWKRQLIYLHLIKYLIKIQKIQNLQFFAVHLHSFIIKNTWSLYNPYNYILISANSIV